MLITTEEGGSFSFQCISAGQFAGKTGWSCPRRSLDSCELIYMLQGEAAIQEGLTLFPLEKGDVLVLAPGTTHFGLGASGRPVSFFWMDFMLDNLSALGLMTSCKVHAGNDALAELFRQLQRFQGDKDYPRQAADLCGLTILIETAAQQRRSAVRCRKVLQDATEWVQQNICSPITVIQVGKALGYNSDYLTALFKEGFGIGLKEYIIEQRLKRTEEYLLTTSLPIKKIAAVMGFHDSNSFIKYFTYHRKMSPSKFRSRYYSSSPGQE
ncbi:MAG: AraC family transcriptional regulator [Oscillospiraceae bacterium]|nr:AraC family transcriptional regulator [Oscillospiraceae bacterium]